MCPQAATRAIQDFLLKLPSTLGLDDEPEEGVQKGEHSEESVTGTLISDKTRGKQNNNNVKENHIIQWKIISYLLTVDTVNILL